MGNMTITPDQWVALIIIDPGTKMYSSLVRVCNVRKILVNCVSQVDVERGGNIVEIPRMKIWNVISPGVMATPSVLRLGHYGRGYHSRAWSSRCVRLHACDGGKSSTWVCFKNSCSRPARAWLFAALVHVWNGTGGSFCCAYIVYQEQCIQQV